MPAGLGLGACGSATPHQVPASLSPYASPATAAPAAVRHGSGRGRPRSLPWQRQRHSLPCHRLPRRRSHSLPRHRLRLSRRRLQHRVPPSPMEEGAMNRVNTAATMITARPALPGTAKRSSARTMTAGGGNRHNRRRESDRAALTLERQLRTAEGTATGTHNR